MGKANKFTTGTPVKTKEHGAGTIELVDEATGVDGAYAVYHVRLENGEVRHFTEDELKAGRGSDE